ncbi:MULTISPECIES: DUF2851 family protein [unclassified Flavobacterium]|uniref:DUF2851 family protein n=1 Tax=unclassified Flavobacterium TaxID=196869 RepID=UPI0012913E4A|nr:MULTISPECIES: DUF2851 family protein [unclassified Flavobacterium]MQP53050.1 DUF2851 family protein [Flavobacterium sp. LMO9]MQP62871.1 DUF2851 family protein [Flavobacterium sp. LMO6]
MKEDFLHHVWQHKKFAVTQLKTTTGESIQILNSGQYLQLAGPDFFNAQLIIGNQKWAGNVEIHLKSSDWYVHNHEKDSNYDSVILHVVWEYDTPIFRNDNSEIPTLELKEFVTLSDLHKYQSLLAQKSWIYCENEICTIDDFIFKNWQERLYFERLERKATEISLLLEELNNDWEAVLFCLLAKNFGLNTNGLLFFNMAKSISFSIIRKESFSIENLEALFFGQANLLDFEFQDTYVNKLQQDYKCVLHKYGISKKVYDKVAFFKHRPDNFPTIRLAQLAILYHTHQNLFSKIMNVNSIDEIYNLFNVEVSIYWESHYNFDKISIQKKKKMSRSFIDLILINSIIPVRFAYEQSLQKEISDEIVDLMKSIHSEKNSIIDKFATIGVHSKNAFDSQSLLQLKKEYCDVKKCLQCAVGLYLLKK